MEIFIGSSKERIDRMKKIATWIQDAKYKPLPWKTPGLFQPGEQSFHTLIEISKRVQGAIFVFGEDDDSWHRDDSVKTTRDNVLLEYGLFTGAIGVKKAIICFEGKPKKPSDLDGINLIDISEDNIYRAEEEINEWLKKLSENKKERDMPVEANNQKDRVAKKYSQKCDHEYLLSEEEKDLLGIFMENGQSDEYSLSLSEIKLIISNYGNLPKNVEIYLFKLKNRGFLERESGRKRAYFITDKGWEWMENTNFSP